MDPALISAAFDAMLHPPTPNSHPTAVPAAAELCPQVRHPLWQAAAMRAGAPHRRRRRTRGPEEGAGGAGGRHILAPPPAPAHAGAAAAARPRPQWRGAGCTPPGARGNTGVRCDAGAAGGLAPHAAHRLVPERVPCPWCGATLPPAQWVAACARARRLRALRRGGRYARHAFVCEFELDGDGGAALQRERPCAAKDGGDGYIPVTKLLVWRGRGVRAALVAKGGIHERRTRHPTRGHAPFLHRTLAHFAVIGKVVSETTPGAEGCPGTDARQKSRPGKSAGFAGARARRALGNVSGRRTHRDGRSMRGDVGRHISRLE